MRADVNPYKIEELLKQLLIDRYGITEGMASDIVIDTRELLYQNSDD